MIFRLGLIQLELFISGLIRKWWNFDVQLEAIFLVVRKNIFCLQCLKWSSSNLVGLLRSLVEELVSTFMADKTSWNCWSNNSEEQGYQLVENNRNNFLDWVTNNVAPFMTFCYSAQVVQGVLIAKPSLEEKSPKSPMSRPSFALKKILKLSPPMVLRKLKNCVIPIKPFSYLYSRKKRPLKFIKQTRIYRVPKESELIT